MTIGLIGRKAGMTRVFTDAGDSLPVTVIEALPNRIVQVKDSKVTAIAPSRSLSAAVAPPGSQNRLLRITQSRACCRARSWSSSASPRARART
jgi:ribosomal protein L3